MKRIGDSRMTEDTPISKQTVEDPLKEPNKRIRKANRQDLIILKNEFNKIRERHIKSSDLELVELTGGILENIDFIEVYVESEDAEGMAFTFSEPTQGNELGDTVFITVKF